MHGRTKDMKGEPVCLESIRTIKESLNIPVIANGDVKSMEDVENTVAVTGVDGVMAARGILENPAMYSGVDTTPDQCIVDWCRLALSTGTSFNCFHHHLIYMCQKRISRLEKYIWQFIVLF